MLISLYYIYNFSYYIKSQNLDYNDVSVKLFSYSFNYYINFYLYYIINFY